MTEKLQIFDMDQESKLVLPGGGWVKAVELARIMDEGSPRSRQINKLGILLAGAVAGSQLETRASLFADSAVPPFTFIESSEFLDGFDLGKQMTQDYANVGVANV